MSRGYIKLHRKIWKHWLWERPDYGFAFVDLLMLASYKKHTKLFKNKLVSTERGEIFTSLRFLANRWNFSTKKVARFLDLLENDKIIVQKRKHKGNTKGHREGNTWGTHISICKYNKYQVQGNKEETLEETLRKQKGNREETNTIRYKESIKKGKEGKRPAEISENSDENDKDETDMLKLWAEWIGKPPSQLLPQEAHIDPSIQRVIRSALKRGLDFWIPLIRTARQKGYPRGNLRFFLETEWMDYEPDKNYDNVKSFEEHVREVREANKHEQQG